MLRIAVTIGIVAIVWTLLPRNQTKLKKLNDQYDYIIVGAGSAGAILAARLSEDIENTVVLLEAGIDNDEIPQADIPLNFLELQKTEFDWQHMTEPQEHSCHGMVENRSAWPSGKALGGSSLINALMAIRGNKHDFDLWEKMGNPGWSFKEVLPYFKRLETVSHPVWSKSDLRGDKGPIIVSDQNALPEVTTAFLKSAEMQGLQTKDINADDQIGAMSNQANVGNGVRQSTANTYLKPAMGRSNLHVLTSAHVTKVLFKGHQAIGVQYFHNGQLKTVYAKKEVVLSAGAVGSPQILMLSGIGPKEHLEDLNIPVVADLPVGQKLWDHVMTDALILTLDKPLAVVKERIGLLDLIKYKLFGTGVLTTSGVIGTAFTYSDKQPAADKNPYIQFIVFGGLFGADKSSNEHMRNMFNYKQEVYDVLHGELHGKDGMTLLPKLLQPRSVGSLKLKSTNPLESPIIDPKYLSHQQDVDVLVDGIRKAQRTLQSSPMKKIGAKILKRIHPNCISVPYDSDAYWECYVRSNTLTVYHPVGTCRMGPDDDHEAVLDSQLRVRGVDGLRVVDASSMPYITSGNTNFPVMMIAEKAADIIRGRT